MSHTDSEFVTHLRRILLPHTVESRWTTPGALAQHIDPRTVQTPALDIIDRELVHVTSEPDGRLIVTMAPQEGKALALDTPVPTPTGWTTMGDLRPGDRVIGGDGRPCFVTWKSPVWADRDCYAVTTGDGERIVADGAHEWVARLARRRSVRVVETVELARPRLKKAQILTAPNGLVLPAADLPLDPYVFGVWLGDGNSDGPRITCHPADIAIRDRFAAVGWPLRRLSEFSWTMTPDSYRRGTSPAKAALRATGALGDKHIPAAYLRANRVQRLALLQGLIDSDGHVMPNGQVEFVSTSRRLAEGVRELVNTLGAKAVLTEGRATIDGRDCGATYRVRFYLADAAHLPRKAERCKDSSVASVRYVTVERCESVATVCIEVDSPDHTFLAGRTMLPTHNSTRVARDFVLAALIDDPDRRVVVASYNQSLANRNGRSIRRLIQGHPELGLQIAPDNGAANDWSISGRDGGVFSVGVGGGLAGRPADLLIIDDPIKDRKEADSEAFRSQVWDWWTDVASARLAPGAPVVIIMTRWHEKDLAGRLLAEPDSPWRCLNIPAQADHDPAKGQTDPLGRQPGEFMVSARRRSTAQWEERKRAAGPRSWQALYQGRPSPPGGRIFHRGTWRYYDIPLWLVREDGSRIVTGMDDLIQSWDMTFKDSNGADYVVGQVWARRGAEAYLLDQVRGRWDFPETCRQFVALTARWPQALLKLIEDKANGPAVIAALRHQVPGIVPEEPHGSKIARAEAVSPFTAAKNVFLPAPELAPWVGDFVEEAAGFPTAEHDDQVDAATQALNRILLQPLTAGQIVTAEQLEPDLADFGAYVPRA